VCVDYLIEVTIFTGWASNSDEVHYHRWAGAITAFIIMGQFLCFIFLIWEVGALWGAIWGKNIVKNMERKLFWKGWILGLLKKCVCVVAKKRGQHVYLCNGSLGEGRLASKVMKCWTTLYEVRRFKGNQTRNFSYYMLILYCYSVVWVICLLYTLITLFLLYQI